MRDDQEEQELGATIATPFSAKAEEDAKRFKIAGTAVPKPIATPVPTPMPAPVAVVEEPPAAPAVPAPAKTVARSRRRRNPLQVALETDEKLDAKACRRARQQTRRSESLRAHVWRRPESRREFAGRI